MAGEPGRHEDAYEAVFSALAHPARRRVLLTVYFNGGSMAAGEIAAVFSHAWQTTTRHLQILEAAGLLSSERDGRMRIYHLARKRLDLVREWLGHFSATPVPAKETPDMADATASRPGTPQLFRLSVEVGDLDRATAFYGELLGIEGHRQAGARCYFDCGPVTLSVLDVSATSTPRTPAKALYFTVGDLEAVFARAEGLGCLSTELVHGQDAGAIVVRPWGERSFYADDPWGNPLCFVERGTVYAG
jgi:DNA-binding transcriptional ArsR family regulator/catechol 2,3-dioxygenase-like lactoylglutathione lyase family enzyme